MEVVDEISDVVRSQAQSLLDGRLKPSEFLVWLHTDIGHGGPEEFQDLVELCDIWMLGR